jgi:hypothetical protein
MGKADEESVLVVCTGEAYVRLLTSAESARVLRVLESALAKGRKCAVRDPGCLSQFPAALCRIYVAKRKGIWCEKYIVDGDGKFMWESARPDDWPISVEEDHGIGSLLTQYRTEEEDYQGSLEEDRVAAERAKGLILLPVVPQQASD